MRISKRVREEAIEALLVCADDRIQTGNQWGLVTEEFNNDREVDALANAAYEAAAEALVIPYVRSSTMFEDYTEAASLLADGWSPGDPVVRRPSSLGKAGNE